MNARPLVAVTGPSRRGMSAWIFTGVAITRAGGTPVRITPRRGVRATDRFDAVVLGGGADVDPNRYAESAGRLGEELSQPLIPMDVARDELELELLAGAHARGIPVLGICRGAQLMNVHFGGTLYRDLTHFYADARMRSTVLPVKRVDIVEGSHLAAALGSTSVVVNSLHKQAVRTLGQGFAVVGSETNGVVQAIEDTRHPFRIGVQWHPEYMPQSRPQQRLFRSLVVAAASTLRERAARPAPLAAGVEGVDVDGASRARQARG